MKYFFLIFLIEVQLIYNVGLISGVQQSSFHILFHVLFIYFIYFFIFFSIVAHNNIEYSSLCYIVGPCFFILYVVVCICQSQICNLSLPHCLPNLAIINLFSMLVSLVLFINKFLCIFFLLSLSISLSPFPQTMDTKMCGKTHCSIAGHFVSITKHAREKQFIWCKTKITERKKAKATSICKLSELGNTIF